MHIIILSRSSFRWRGSNELNLLFVDFSIIFYAAVCKYKCCSRHGIRRKHNTEQAQHPPSPCGQSVAWMMSTLLSIFVKTNFSFQRRTVSLLKDTANKSPLASALRIPDTSLCLRRAGCSLNHIYVSCLDRNYGQGASCRVV